jgi:hypothetical protein
MKNSLHYVKVKRDREGICNICGKESLLSWDHVPPKGSIVYDDVEVISIANSFVEIENPPKEFSQNGMKFRTICSDCNNLIGSKYDIVFNNFITRLISKVGENFEQLSPFVIDVNLESLIKSIFAHLLAGKGEIENTVPDIRMREFLLQKSDLSNINIHYWFYPFTINQVIRDILIGKIFDGKNALVSIMKLYPVAFLVTESDMFLECLPRLNNYEFKEDGESIIEFDISKFYDYMWPIVVDDSTIIMGGQSINSSVISVPRLGLRK